MAFTKFKYNGNEYQVNQIDNTYDLLMMKSAYFTSGGFKDGSYLTRWPGEAEESYKFRKEVAYYDNVHRNEMDTYANGIYSKGVIREGYESNPVLDNFVKDPTKKGKSFDRTMRDYLLKSCNYGSGFIVVDSKKFDQGSELDDIDPDRAPYMMYIAPQDILGYGFNEAGALNLLVYLQDVLKTGKKRVNVFKVWLVDVDGEPVTFEIHGTKIKEDTIKLLDVFPVVMLETQDREDETKPATPKDFPSVKAAKNRYNQASIADVAYHKNTFSILTYQGTIGEDEKLGADGIIEYPEENDRPDWISPKSDHIKEMNDNNDKKRQEIRQNMNSTVEVSVSASTDTRESAEGRLYRSQKEMALYMQDIELKIFNIIIPQYIANSPEVSVTYQTDFEITGATGQIEKFQKAIETGSLSETVIAEIGIDVIKYCYPNNPKRAQDLIALQEQEVNNLKQGNGSDDKNDDFGDNQE